MGPIINTQGDDGAATFSMDGLELIYSSGCKGTGLCNVSTLRRSTRETLDSEWTTPERMTRSRRGDLVGSAMAHSLSPDGLSLYFNAFGSFGNLDVFVAKRPSLDAPFGEREILDATINTSGRDTGVQIAPDGALYYGYGWNPSQLGLRIWRAEPEDTVALLGDFDNSGVLDIFDIDALMVQVAVGENPTTYDLNNDALINTEDIRVWVKDLANTWFGDANLDGEFTTGDLITVFQSGKYELDVAASWAEGDWNADHRFNSGDLISAFQDGGFEKGPRFLANAVPEPGGFALLAIGVVGLCCLRKRQ